MNTLINTTMLYHISDRPNLSLLFPRVPQHRLLHEDDIIARICFSDSIAGCLSAISDKSQCLYVYKVAHVYKHAKFFSDIPNAPLSDMAIGISNSDLIKNELVDDAHVTNEVWVCEPVGLKLIGEVVLCGSYTTTLTHRFNNRKFDEIGVVFPDFIFKKKNQADVIYKYYITVYNNRRNNVI